MGDDIGSGSVTTIDDKLRCTTLIVPKPKQIEPEPMSSLVNYPS